MKNHPSSDPRSRRFRCPSNAVEEAAGRRGRLSFPGAVAVLGGLGLLAACANGAVIGNADTKPPVPAPMAAHASERLMPLPECPPAVREACRVLEMPWSHSPIDVASAGADLIGAVDPLTLRRESALFGTALATYRAGVRFLSEEPASIHAAELVLRMEGELLISALRLRRMAGTTDI